MIRGARTAGGTVAAILSIVSLLVVACGSSSPVVPSTPTDAARPSASSAPTSASPPVSASAVATTNAGTAPFVGALSDSDAWVVDSIGVPGGGVTIRLSRADGSEQHPVPLGGGPFYHGHPEWLPDGSGFTYLSATDERLARSIHRYDVASGTSEVIVDCVAPCIDATEQAVSPDGRRIAWFFADGPLEDVDVDGQAVPIPATCGLRLRAIDAGHVTDLTASPCGLVEERFPRWSPHGDRLAYVRTHQASRGDPIVESEIVVRDVATNEEIVVFRIDGAVPDDIDWMPRGRQIVYAIADDLFFIDPVNEPYRRHRDAHHIVFGATGTDRLAHHPRVTDDGRWITFHRTEGVPGAVTRGSLWAVPTDGGEAQLVWPLAPAGPSALHTLWGSLQPLPGSPG